MTTFLNKAGLQQNDVMEILDIFTAERIDIDVLQGMTQEELKEIAGQQKQPCILSAFGVRHKLLRAATTQPEVSDEDETTAAGNV